MEGFAFGAAHILSGSLNLFLPLQSQGFPYCYLFRWYFGPGSLQVSEQEGIFIFVFFTGLHINFSKSDLHLHEFLFFGGYVGILPPDKLTDIQQLALSLLWMQPVTVYWVMSFLGKANFCASGHS